MLTKTEPFSILRAPSHGFSKDLLNDPRIFFRVCQFYIYNKKLLRGIPSYSYNNSFFFTYFNHKIEMSFNRYNKNEINNHWVDKL